MATWRVLSFEIDHKEYQTFDVRFVNVAFQSHLGRKMRNCWSSSRQILSSSEDVCCLNMNYSVIVLCMRKENSSHCLDYHQSHYVNIIFG